MKGILKFIHFAFSNLPSSRQIALLRSNRQIVDIIVTILYNIAHKNVLPADNSIINKLSKYRKDIYRLINSRTSPAKRSAILVSNKDIVTTILPLIPGIAANIENEPLYEDVPDKRKRQKVVR